MENVNGGLFSRLECISSSDESDEESTDPCKIGQKSRVKLNPSELCQLSSIHHREVYSGPNRVSDHPLKLSNDRSTARGVRKYTNLSHCKTKATDIGANVRNYSSANLRDTKIETSSDMRANAFPISEAEISRTGKKKILDVLDQFNTHTTSGMMWKNCHWKNLIRDISCHVSSTVDINESQHCHCYWF